jgi:hypothetical protein
MSNSKRTRAEYSGDVEIASFKNVGIQMQIMGDLYRKRQRLGLVKELHHIRLLTLNAQKEDNMQLIGMEAIMSIVDYNIRRGIKKTKLLARISDEKELSVALQQHKDDFAQFICQKRAKGKVALREIFQMGGGSIGKYGDLVSDYAMETIQAFELANNCQLVRDGIAWETLDVDDMPSFVERRIALAKPKIMTTLSLLPSRLEVELLITLDSKGNQPGSERSEPYWTSVYAVCGIWKVCTLIYSIKGKTPRKTASPKNMQANRRSIIRRGQFQNHSVLSFIHRASS